jgi:hypothetical protein
MVHTILRLRMCGALLLISAVYSLIRRRGFSNFTLLVHLVVKSERCITFILKNADYNTPIRKRRATCYTAQ